MLMQKVAGQNESGGKEITQIINPSVQTNLNDLIKTQRDKIVRMSQDQSFRVRPGPGDVAGKYQNQVMINQNGDFDAQE